MKRSYKAILAIGAAIASFAPNAGAQQPDAASDDAPPDVKTACIDAADQSQRLRAQGKIEESRVKLLACAESSCPAIVRQNCEQWLKEVLANQSTVVFAARDSEGHDLVAVRVLVDGVAVTDTLDGRAVPMDTGVHKITFVVQGGKQVDQQIVIREAEKARVILASIPPSEPSDAKPSESSGSKTPVLAYVLGGVGIAAGLAGGYFGVVQYTDAKHLQSSCSPTCSTSDVDSIRSERVAGWILGGVSVIALGAAAYFLLSSHHSAAPPPAAIGIDVRPIGTQGTMLQVGGRF